MCSLEVCVSVKHVCTAVHNRYSKQCKLLQFFCSQVTESDRSKAKQIAYGLIYGMGSGELGKRLGCGELEARAASDDFKRSHPVLMKWIEVR